MSRRTIIIAVILALAGAVAISFLLGSDLGSSTSTTTKTQLRTQTQVLQSGEHSCDPTAGSGHMGVCIPKAPSAPHLSLTVSGPFLPDVYEGNGCKNWPAARGHIAGGIVKATEYRVDSCLSENWHGLIDAHLWHAAYDFLRSTYTVNGTSTSANACNVEADRYVAAVKSVGGFDSGPPVADAEVPLPAGFVACWVARVKHDLGITTVIVYTAPGTWPGGGNPGALLWVASYGPAPGCVWTCAHVAWQFTDGQIGPQPHCTIVGCGDISTDNGITHLLAHPKPVPPKTKCFGHGSTPKSKKCKPIVANVAKWTRARDASQRAYRSQGCPVLHQRVNYFAGQLKKHPKVKTTSRKHALAASRRAYNQRHCGTFAQRITYFGAKVASTTKTYS